MCTVSNADSFGGTRECTPIQYWDQGCTDEAQWFYVMALPAEVQAQYPLVFDDDCVYLSTELQPIASIGVPSSVIAGRSLIS